MSEYTTIKLVTRPDGSVESFDFTSYVPKDVVSAIVKPIIDAVAATANEDRLQRQQGRELYATMMRGSAKESAEDEAVDAAESAERDAEAEADKAAEETRAAEAAEMTGSDETDKFTEDKAVDAAIAWLAQRLKPERVAAIIKGWVKATS